MRIACLLFRLSMDWFRSSFFYSVFVWLWRGALFVWRFLRALLSRAVAAVPRLPLGRQDEGGESEPGGESAGHGEGGDPREGVEQRWGQSEAPGAKRDMACDRQSPCRAGREVGRKEEEEEEDDFGGREYCVPKTDELYCDDDSTWEAEEGDERPSWMSRTFASMNGNFVRFGRAARDMHKYRQSCRPSPPRHRSTLPPLSQDRDRIQYMGSKGYAQHNMPNLQFYLGNIPSKPDNVFIRGFHDEWKSDYQRLEYVHSYIQWLFPLQEPGMNSFAEPMTREEVQEFRRSDVAKSLLLESYTLMLDFYGIKLCDIGTGEVARASNWRSRFNNLNSHTHNNLRITRILKCLGMLGFERYQAPLVRFFLQETLVNGELPAVKESVLSYFLFAVLDKKERRKLLKFAFLNYKPQREFVWCPKKVQQRWSHSKQAGEWGGASCAGPFPH